MSAKTRGTSVEDWAPNQKYEARERLVISLERKDKEDLERFAHEDRKHVSEIVQTLLKPYLERKRAAAAEAKS